jgi:ParB family chromosome partitioning protein
MDKPAGDLNPDYPLASIDAHGGVRHDLGDLTPLMESIQQLGLLTPLVVTADGVLLCGKRRLAAVARLGWDTVAVWIPAMVTKELRLWAVHDDHILTKPMAPTEQAALYAEYRRLYTAQARLRYEVTRFQPGHTRTSSVALAGDQTASTGRDAVTLGRVEGHKSRVKAALAVTGADSHQRMEQVLELQQIAADPTQPESVRQDAAQAVSEVDVDGKVHPRWQRVKHHQHTHAACSSESTLPDLFAAEKRQIRTLVVMLGREQGWWNRYDPVQIARHADAGQWRLIESYIEETCRFFDQARTRGRVETGAPGG